MHHDLPIWLQIQTIYNGLGATNRFMIDATTGGTLMSKKPEAPYTLLEELASKNYQLTFERVKPKQVVGVLG